MENIVDTLISKFQPFMGPEIAQAVKSMLEKKDRTVLIDLQLYSSLLPFSPESGPDKEIISLLEKCRSALGAMVINNDDCRERLHKLLTKYPNHSSAIKKVLTLLDLPDDVTIEGQPDFEFRAILSSITAREDVVEINEIFIFVNRMLVPG